MQYPEEWNSDKPEPAPINGVVQIGDAQFFGIAVKNSHFLGSCEQACVRFQCCPRSYAGVARWNDLRLVHVATCTELGGNWRFLVRNECAQPIFVGEAKPATSAIE